MAKTKPTLIPDVIEIHPEVFNDTRGFFLETYHKQKYFDLGIELDFVQDNWSRSQRGTLRGLHYQIQQPQGKLVFLTEGEIYDIAIDMRRSSPSFGKYVGTTLSAKQQNQLWIPPGFAHGFLVLSEWANLIYKTTDFYAPQFERTLLWNDPALGIEWPIPPGVDLIISAKDIEGQPFSSAEKYG